MKLYNGIRHTVNARENKIKRSYILNNPQFEPPYKYRCKAYFKWYDKNCLTLYKIYKNRLPDELIGNTIKRHFKSYYESLYTFVKNGRVKKASIRKAFYYWNKMPMVYFNKNSEDDDKLMTSYPMYNGNRNDVYYFDGTPGCEVSYITFFNRNKKALTKKQQKRLEAIIFIKNRIENTQ